MNTQELVTAAKIARRELRGGFSGFMVFLACLAIGVAAIAAVGVFSKSVSETVQRDSRIILGGDIAFETTSTRLDPAELRAITPDAAEVASTFQANSVMRASSGRSVVVSLKGAGENYPLFGEVVLEPAMPLEEALADGGAVAEPALFSRLGVELGDRVDLGNGEVVLRATLVEVPDRLGGFVNLGPTVLASVETAEAAGIVQEGSLVRWRYGVALDTPRDTESLTRRLAEQNPDAEWRVRGSHEVEPQVARFSERLSTYLTMAGLAALLVGGLGVGLAVQSYLADKTQTIATLKCLGARSSLVFQAYLAQILALTALGVLAGLILGQVLPFLAASITGSMLPIALEIGFYAQPMLIAAGCGLVSSLVFALWPLALARETSPATLFRSLVQPVRQTPRPVYLAILGAMLVAFALLAILGTERPEMGAIFVAVAAVSAVALVVIARLLLRGVGRIAEVGPVGLRLGARNMTRPGSGAESVVVALGAGLAVLTTVALLDANLSRELRESVPDRAPSTIFIDIQADQWERFQEIVAEQPDARIDQSYPMLRARVTRFNGEQIDRSQVDEEVRWTLNRDRGLTFQAEPREQDDIIAGSWWPADYSGPPLVSLDEEIARGYGLEIGDTMTFGVLGRSIEAEVANLRGEVDWSNGRLDFLFVMSPGVIDQAPYTIVASVEMDEASEPVLFDRLAAELPNVTPIAIGEVVERIAGILAKIGLAIRSVAGVTLVTGVLVLAGAINAARRRQRYQSVILKVLGARRLNVLRMLASEYLTLGAAAAVLGALLGSIGAWAITVFAIGIPWSFSLAPVVALAVITLGVTLGLGAAAVWQLLGRSSAAVLRAP